jgi:hypothetical protein
LQGPFKIRQNWFGSAPLHQMVGKPQGDAIDQEQGIFTFADLISEVESILKGPPMAGAATPVARDSSPHFFIYHFRGIGRYETDWHPGGCGQGFSMPTFPAAAAPKDQVKKGVHDIRSGKGVLLAATESTRLQ